MKINYPIKYTAMPIIEQVGWTHGLHDLEREYGVVCYIVSKCYLITTLEKYKENGSIKHEYEIVFPYQIGDYGKWQRKIPNYHLIQDYCVNSNKVNEVFDSYEEALKYVESKNDKLCEMSWKYLPYSENYDEKIQNIIDEFNEKLKEYKVLEKQILLNTNDIVVGQNKKLNDVIKVTNDEIKNLSSNIYKVLSLYANENFVVYSISDDEYNNLIKNTDGKPVIENAQILLIHNEKDNFIKLLSEEEQKIYYIENNIIVYDEKLDRVTKETFEKIDKNSLAFYTTETMLDIMNSYKEYEEIDLNEIKETVKKKVLK